MNSEQCKYECSGVDLSRNGWCNNGRDAKGHPLIHTHTHKRKRDFHYEPAEVEIDGNGTIVISFRLKALAQVIEFGVKLKWHFSVSILNALAVCHFIWVLLQTITVNVAVVADSNAAVVPLFCHHSSCFDHFFVRFSSCLQPNIRTVSHLPIISTVLRSILFAFKAIIIRLINFECVFNYFFSNIEYGDMRIGIFIVACFSLLSVESVNVIYSDQHSRFRIYRSYLPRLSTVNRQMKFDVILCAWFSAIRRSTWTVHLPKSKS